MWYGAWYDFWMDAGLERFLDLLDRVEVETVNTSVRLPVALRDAAALAVGMGFAESMTELTVRSEERRVGKECCR